MDFRLTEEHEILKKTCQDFAAREIKPYAEEWDATEKFPYETWKRMASLGLCGIPVEKKYGGTDGGWLATTIATEWLSWGDASFGVTYEVHLPVVMNLIITFGTEEQKARWLPEMARGEKIGAFGLTEPDAGSDAGSIKTRAVKDGNTWVINGSKQFITNAGLDNSNLVIVAAVTGIREGGKKMISNFIVPRGTPGYIIGKRYKKMGWHASFTNELFFEDCRVPDSHTLGNPERGFSQFLDALQMGRVAFGIHAVGLAQAIFDETIKYARERVQFGQPLCKFQVIQFKLADMIMEIELARLMLYKAAWLKDQGMDYVPESTYGKLFASEAARHCAHQGVQIHGGCGFCDDYAVSRYWRDVKIDEIGEGTSEVQRMVIARRVLKL